MKKFVSQCCQTALIVVYAKKDVEKDFWQCTKCQKETMPAPTINGFIPSIWPKIKK